MSDDNKIQVEFGASTEGVEKGSTAAAQAVESAVERMKTTMGGAGTAVQGMHGQFATAFEGMKTSVAGFLGHFGGTLNFDRRPKACEVDPYQDP